jgi:hypothetical protein
MRNLLALSKQGAISSPYFGMATVVFIQAYCIKKCAENANTINDNVLK